MNLFLITFSIFIILSLSLIIIYFTSGNKNKTNITTFLSLFSGSVIILNLLLMLLNNYESNKLKKIEQVSKLNDKSLSFTNTIYNKFNSDKQSLEKLHNEIFYGTFEKPVIAENVALTYEETNMLFIIFQYVENIFRVYFIEGGEKSLYNDTVYEGWEAFIIKLMRSPKTQLFYITFKEHYKSLGFYKWLENKYIKRNNYFNIQIAKVDEGDKIKYGIN